MPRILIALAALMTCCALPAPADWEYEFSAEGSVWCVVADDHHSRVFFGTSQGFVHLDIASDLWSSVEAGGGVGDLVLFPDQADKLLLTRSASGDYIQITEDLGQTLQTVHELDTGRHFRDLAPDPRDPDRVFAVVAADGGVIPQGSLLLSEDGGWTWSAICESDSLRFHCAAMDHNGDIYLGTEDGILVSRDEGATWESGQGDLPAGPGINSLRIAPGSASGHLYACTYGLYETWDGGEHWQALYAGWSCPTVAVHPQEPSLLAAWISPGMGSSDLIPISRDSGQSWVLTGYSNVSADYGSLADLDISATSDRIYTNNFDEIYSYPLSLTAVETPPAAGPSLAQNHPNPFNPATEIRFELAEPGAATLRIFDARGRLVATLLDDEMLDAGPHRVQWRGRDGAGEALPSGVYLCRLEAAGEILSRKMTLLL